MTPDGADSIARPSIKRPPSGVVLAVAVMMVSLACGGTVHPGASGPGRSADQALDVPALGDAAATQPAETLPATESNPTPAATSGDAQSGAPSTGMAASTGPKATPAVTSPKGTAAAHAGSPSQAPKDSAPAPGTPNASQAPAPGAPSNVEGPARSGNIKVGGVFPLSGPLGAFGQDLMQMMRALFTKVNQEGGIGGAKIEFIVYDDQFDPAQGKRYVRELISQKVFAFAGFTPGTYEAVKGDLAAAGIPGFPMDVGVEKQRTDRLAFPPHSGCLRSQAGTIDEIARRGRKKVAFIELDIAAIHRCIDYSVAVAKKLGVEVVYRGSVAPGSPDCGPQLLAARSKNPDVLIPFVDPLGNVKCLQAREQQGWNVDVELSVPIPGDTQMIDVLGEAVEGMRGISMFGVPGEPEWEAKCGAVRQYFPNDKYLSVYSSIGCISAFVLISALRALGPGATQAQLIAYLESHVIPSRGITPEDMHYRPGDHRPHDSVIPMEVKGGRWVRSGQAFTPTRLSDEISDGD